ncbi:hypothetical protein C8Q80DRAFT_1265765 [Daedaleopsis nitida]|nr:hypothetical protein C8Q80DRAFT_1265765 [Daedaleopsis nitida]
MISNNFVAFAILAMVADVSTRPVDLGQYQSALTSSPAATLTQSVVTVTSTRTVATGTPALSTPSTVNTPAPSTSVIPAWVDPSWETYVLSHPSGYIPPTYILPVPTLGAATSATSDLAQYLLTEAAPSPVPTAPSPRVDVVSDSHIPNSTGLPTTESLVAATPVETESALPAAPTTTLPGSAPSISAPAENDSLVAQPSAPASVSSLPASMPSAVAPVSSSPAIPVASSGIPDAPTPSAPSTPAVPAASA